MNKVIAFQHTSDQLLARIADRKHSLSVRIKVLGSLCEYVARLKGELPPNEVEWLSAIQQFMNDLLMVRELIDKEVNEL